MNTLSIIIPAYNEGEHIYSVAQSVLSAKEKYHQDRSQTSNVEVVIVNDGSDDTTSDELRRVQEKLDAKVVVVHHAQNKGYGAALKTGFDAASGNYLSFMDGDGTIEPSSLFSMFDQIVDSKADMAVGLRFSNQNSQMPKIRKLGNVLFCWLLSFLSGEKVGDTASGVRVFRRDVLDQLYPLPDGLHFTPAMSTKAVHEKLKVLEVPIDYRDRSGESKLHVLKDGVRFLKIIVGTVLMYNPFKVFLLVGLLFECIAAALVFSPLQSMFSNQVTQFSDYIYRSIGAFYFFVGGVQIILFGILARFLVSTFFRRFERGDWIHRVNDVLKVYERMSLYGVGVLSVGVSINAYYFLIYLREGNLGAHWGWLLLAAMCIVVGIQMVITGVLMRILKDIRVAISKDYIGLKKGS